MRLTIWLLYLPHLSATKWTATGSTTVSAALSLQAEGPYGHIFTQRSHSTATRRPSTMKQALLPQLLNDYFIASWTTYNKHCHYNINRRPSDIRTKLNICFCQTNLLRVNRRSYICTEIKANNYPHVHNARQVCLTMLADCWHPCLKNYFIDYWWHLAGETENNIPASS